MDISLPKFVHFLPPNSVDITLSSYLVKDIINVFIEKNGNEYLKCSKGRNGVIEYPKLNVYESAIIDSYYFLDTLYGFAVISKSDVRNRRLNNLFDV